MNLLNTHKLIMVDSNVWISYFLVGDDRHFDAKKELGKYINQNFQIIIPSIVIIEIIAVLNRKKVSKNLILKAIEEIKIIKNSQIVELSHSKLLETAERLIGKIKLRAQDFTIFIYHVIFKTNKIITYDSELLGQFISYKNDY